MTYRVTHLDLGSPILFSDKKSVYYPVTPDDANEGGTKLVPENLITKDIEHLISGQPVESITLQDLISFAKTQTVIIKIDVEVFLLSINN